MTVNSWVQSISMGPIFFFPCSHGVLITCNHMGKLHQQSKVLLIFLCWFFSACDILPQLEQPQAHLLHSSNRDSSLWFEGNKLIHESLCLLGTRFVSYTMSVTPTYKVTLGTRTVTQVNRYQLFCNNYLLCLLSPLGKYKVSQGSFPLPQETRSLHRLHEVRAWTRQLWWRTWRAGACCAVGTHLCVRALSTSKTQNQRRL